MDENIKDIGFESQLKNLIADVVRSELTLFEQRLKEFLPEKKPIPDRLFAFQVADFLGINKQTVYNYRKNGVLPPPQVTLTGRAYWTKEQIIEGLRAHDKAWKYGV
jgi:predicted DNA-binding transcriptional regulator AlpA